MATFKVPDEGVALVRGQHDGKSSSLGNPSAQIMRLNLAQHTAERILKTLRNDEKVKLRFGKRVSLEFGKTVQHIQAIADTYPSELFLSNKDKPDLLYFSGKLSHTFEVQKAQRATEQSDEALANLQNSLKSMQEQRASNEASFITNKDDVRQLASSKKSLKTHRPSPLLSDKASAFRKDHLLSGITRSTPSSPFLGASFSPSQGPTSAPLLPSSTTGKEKIRLDAIRIPLIHLLAVRPLTPKTIAQNLHATKEDVDKLLEKFAKDCRESMGKKELKEKSYKELDVWKFPYPSQNERQAAVDRAVHAFDRMRVGRSDNLWQLLLPEERRGKGECLSKLNFDQPVPSIRTPKLVSDQSLLAAKGDSANEDDTDANRGRPTTKPVVSATRTQSQNPVHKKRVSEKEAMSKQHMRKDLPEQAKPFAQKSIPKTVAKTKQAGKFKSAERIEDSDEEMEEAVLAPSTVQAPPKERGLGARPALAATKLPKLPSSSSPAPKKSLHKSQLSHSSVADSSTSAMPDGQTLKPHSHQRSESTPRGVSPRPRNGSSPHKPSPLASSPPENANDLDTSSTSKSSNSSTEASSPPSSSDLRNVKASLNSSGHKRNSPSVMKSPLKRKADTSEDDPTAKRHQVNGIPQKPLTNGASSHNPPQQPGTLHRKISESEAESASSPEKGDQVRVSVYEKSRKFKDYYRRYKEMHAKVTNGDQKDGEAIKQLNKMHERIAALKQEIWDDWKKLEDTGSQQ
jgi:RNA polymerase II elongation factor ELL